MQPPQTEQEAKLADAVRRGATMEEIARLKEPIATTPEEALRALKIGNARFFGGFAKRPEISANERRALILAQTPFAAVLGCSDSRVPLEIVFDQNLGDLFVVRVAGNVALPGTLGSIEYAIERLKVHLVVVMGHEGCGAVKGAMLTDEERAEEPENVRIILEKIRPAVADLPTIRDEKARMREAVVANVRQQAHALRQNLIVQRGLARGQIALVGAYFSIGSGAVDFFETEEDLSTDR